MIKFWRMSGFVELIPQTINSVHLIYNIYDYVPRGATGIIPEKGVTMLSVRESGAESRRQLLPSGQKEKKTQWLPAPLPRRKESART